MPGTNQYVHGCNTSRNYTRISIFKITKAKSGMPEHKNGKNNVWRSIFFSFMRLCSKSPSYNWVPQLFLIPAVFFKKSAIIIATNRQKTLIWKLNKVILFGMYNQNFEAIN